MDYQKYRDALQYESPDTVLGSIMSEIKFPKLNSIMDACDYQVQTNRQHDLKLIEQYQPMFFNVEQHRLVNRQDVLSLLEKLQNKTS